MNVEHITILNKEMQPKHITDAGCSAPKKVKSASSDDKVTDLSIKRLKRNNVNR